MSDYNNSLRDINNLCRELLDFCNSVNFPLPEEVQECCNELEHFLGSSVYNVMVMGMFSRGKSTFLNALIGKRILFESDREATGAITFINNSSENAVTIHSASEKSRFPLDDDSYEKIRTYVDKNNSEASGTQVVIDCEMKGFDEDICFIDTPGLNGISEEQTRVTRAAMEKADAVIMLVSPKSLDIWILITG